MKTIAINSNNDIYLDNFNNLALKNDLDAMGDIFVNKSQTNTGELLYNADKGVDFFNTVFSSPAYPDLFQHELINELKDTDSTQNVRDFVGEVQKNVYSYSVKIQTDYGELTLNG